MFWILPDENGKPKAVGMSEYERKIGELGEEIRVVASFESKFGDVGSVRTVNCAASMDDPLFIADYCGDSFVASARLMSLEDASEYVRLAIEADERIVELRRKCNEELLAYVESKGGE